MTDTFTPRYEDCPRCGTAFYRDEYWKRTCVHCWREKKRARQAGTSDIDIHELQAKYQSGQDHRIELARAWNQEKSAREQAERQLYLTQLERDVAKLRVRELETELHNSRLTARRTAIEPAMIKRLIQLCHPDKHGGSTASQTATAWLLEQRT